MEIVNYVQSWKKLGEYVRRYNEGLIVGIRRDLQPRYDLRRKLRTEHVSLLRLMIRLYALQLRGTDPQALAALEELPPFETNSPALAKVLDCSPRTIRNLIARLVEARTLVKVHRGRKANYQIRFSAELLAYSRGVFPGDLQRIESEIRALDRAALEQADTVEGKSLPLLVASKPNKENNLGCGKPAGDLTGNSAMQEAEAGAEKTGNSAMQEAEVGAEKTGNSAMQEAEAEKTGKPTMQEGEVGAEKTGNSAMQEGEVGAEKTGNPAAEQETVMQEEAGNGLENGPAPASDPVVPFDAAAFEDYYIRLFSLIQAVLYPKLDYFAESQVFAVHRYLRGKFAQVPPENYQELYLELRTRVLMVEGYVKRKSGRFVPIPARYFDPDNARGFEGTARWYARLGQSVEKRRHYAERYRAVMRTWDGFLQTLSPYLDPPDWNRYRDGHARIRKDYPGFLQVYDYVVLSNLQADRMIYPTSPT